MTDPHECCRTSGKADCEHMFWTSMDSPTYCSKLTHDDKIRAEAKREEREAALGEVKAKLLKLQDRFAEEELKEEISLAQSIKFGSARIAMGAAIKFGSARIAMGAAIKLTEGLRSSAKDVQE